MRKFIKNSAFKLVRCISKKEYETEQHEVKRNDPGINKTKERHRRCFY